MKIWQSNPALLLRRSIDLNVKSFDATSYYEAAAAAAAAAESRIVLKLAACLAQLGVPPNCCSTDDVIISHSNTAPVG